MKMGQVLPLSLVYEVRGSLETEGGRSPNGVSHDPAAADAGAGRVESKQDRRARKEHRTWPLNVRHRRCRL